VDETEGIPTNQFRQEASMLTHSIVSQIQQVAKKWRTDLSLPFEDILPATVVVTAAAIEGITFRQRFFPSSGDAVGFSGPGAQ
jgi:hypothetical protein